MFQDNLRNKNILYNFFAGEPSKPRLSITPSYKVKSQMIREQTDSQARVAATTNVQDMCKTLQEWDEIHPKYTFLLLSHCYILRLNLVPMFITTYSLGHNV